eukprot:Selendium_serpulae@DN4473_c0_g1_i2.p1
MGRMYGPGKGISRSARPYSNRPPVWVHSKIAHAATLEETIGKFAKKGMRASQIGRILRDIHAIPRVKPVTGSRISRILRKIGLAPEIPEDLYFLIYRANTMHKHLEKWRNDTDSKFRLVLCEARIRRLTRYYKRMRRLPPTYKYNPVTAKAIVA